MFGSGGATLFGGTTQQGSALFSAASRPAGPATTPVTFGGASTTTSSTVPLQTSQPLFGGAASTAPSLFGSSASTAGSSFFSSQANAAATTTPSKPGLFTGGSSLFGGSSNSLFGPSQPSSFGGPSLVSGGASSGLFSGSSFGGLGQQQTSMIAPTNLFAPALLAHQPPPPVGDVSHLTQASKDPSGIFASLPRDLPLQDLAQSPEAASIKRARIEVQPFAVPVEKWVPTTQVQLQSRKKPAFCDLLDIAPKGTQQPQGSFREWLDSGKASVAQVESAEVVEISIKGLPEGPVRVPKSYTVAYLKARVCRTVKGVDANQVRLWCCGRVLESEEGLGSVRNGAEMYYVIDEKKEQGVKEIAADKYLPTLTRPEYSTVPSLTDIARMSLSELQSVHNFTIRNAHGSVEFPGRTDLTALDLDSIVHIYKDSVVLYPEGCKKPKVGEGLNKKAKITLFQIFPRSTMPTDLFREKLRKACLKDKTSFYSYEEDSGSWVFTTNPEKTA